VSFVLGADGGREKRKGVLAIFDRVASTSLKGYYGGGSGTVRGGVADSGVASKSNGRAVKEQVRLFCYPSK
jgi:hypothetical protein